MRTGRIVTEMRYNERFPESRSRDDNRNFNGNAAETLYETSRDVKWICEALRRMERRDEDFEKRLRRLESFKSENAGMDKKDRQISAGIGAGAGSLAAVLLKVIGGG
ncbi:hypothetical protein Metlim_2323 [Methanoplanus limicola DSM 2279]|uniref:Uncharacterized protein n=2 Tax=Methanoplanus limicola TaxID=2315 RepID=H1Z232_9EURY|nr:hypothetical protein Metlim_2323 [Methanoplanus limicola DSM 2279]